MVFYIKVLLLFSYAVLASCVQSIQLNALMEAKALMRKELDSQGRLVNGGGGAIKRKEADHNSTVLHNSNELAADNLVCEKWDTSGFHDGTNVKDLTKDMSPDGQQWTWRQCAKECSLEMACEFWSLQNDDRGHCFLKKDKTTYHDGPNDQGHIEGAKSAACDEAAGGDAQTAAEFHALHDDPNCTNVMKIENGWCEQACTDDAASPVAQACGLATGTCHDTSFSTFLHVMAVGVFVKDTDSQFLNVQSQGSYVSDEAAQDCNSHTMVAHDAVCEQMCIGEDHQHFAERRNLEAGTCAEKGFDKFLGEKRMKTFGSTDSEETEEIAKENEIADEQQHMAQANQNHEHNPNHQDPNNQDQLLQKAKKVVRKEAYTAGR